MALVGQYDRVLPSQGDLGYFGLVSQAGGKVVLQLCRVVHDYFLRSSMVFLSPRAQLAISALSESEQFFLCSQNHAVIVPASNFDHLLVPEEVYELWHGQVLLVGMPQLPQVLIKSAPAPRVNLSVSVEGEGVEVSAGDIGDLLSLEMLYFVDAAHLMPSFVPQSASPREYGAFLGERESVVVATGNLGDLVLSHGSLQVELPEVVNLGADTYLAEEQRSRHVYLPLCVDDCGVAAGRCDRIHKAPEAFDGSGGVSSFCSDVGELSFLVAPPRVHQGSFGGDG